MKDKYLKKIFIIVSLIILLFVIYKMVGIYAVFYSEGTAQISQQQSDWIIRVNSEMISNGVNQTFSINEISLTSDSHVLSGKIAPGISGNFYITIDPHDTDVAIEYDILLDLDGMDHDNFQITSVVEENRGAPITFVDGVIHGIISLQDVQSNLAHRLRLSIEWENDEQYNNEDTEIGMSGANTVSIPVRANVYQYLGV